MRREVRADVVVEEAVRLRRAQVAGDEAEARADLPATTESVAADGGQDVRLVEVEEVLGLVGAVAANAARERVRDEAEEARVRLVAKERLETERAALARVALRPGR